MKRFREHISCKIFAIITAVLFLNMGFVIAELHFLEIDKDTRLSRMISLFMSGTCSEEEREAGADTSEEDTSKKIDLAFHYYTQSLDEHSILSTFKCARDITNLLSHTKETLTQPPED